jgi:nicotinate phosphoribosyltransferase
MNSAASSLLIDLYQLNMVQAYLAHGHVHTAAFELFVRKLPEHRNFLLAVGLEEAVEFLEALQFPAKEIDWLASTGKFNRELLEYLGELRFSGDVDAMPEGTVFFENEPILRVTAPLPQAQLVETRLLNILHFQTVIASKAARMVFAAPGKLLVDFGLRRAHGAEAGLLAARASYIAGFAGSATVLAQRLFGIPSFGTMAHSFVQSYENETEAFVDFARARPDNLTLLIDTYDTEEAARKVVALAPRLAAEGIRIRGVRLDSGNLDVLSRSVRRILDQGGLRDVTIFASGGIDEHALAALVSASAPIDGFGIGTSLTTSSDAPALDCAYKLQEYAGLPRRKRSVGKATWPGRKQVWRHYGPDGRMSGDVLSLANDDQHGEPLLQPIMRDGQRVGPSPSLTDIRAHAGREIARLPKALRHLEQIEAYPVQVADALVRLAAEVDRRLAEHGDGKRQRQGEL